MSTGVTAHDTGLKIRAWGYRKKKAADHYVEQKDPSRQASGRVTYCAIQCIDVISVCTPKCEAILNLFTVLDGFKVKTI